MLRACTRLTRNTQAEILQYTVEFATSVCIDPAESRIAVGSEKEKRLFENKCKKWSAFIGSSQVFNVNQFSTSGIPPVNRFAQAIIKDWMGSELPPPSSLSLYNSPGSFGFVKVGPDQPKTHTLIVWKSRKGGPGMVGYILDEFALKGEADPMARYQVLYPSHKSEPKGKLVVLDASTLEKYLSAKKNDFSVIFLRPSSTVPLYWNQWIQGKISDSDDPPRLLANTSFSYHLDLSALNFRVFIKDKNAGSPRISKQEADILVPELGKYKITVFPIGNFQDKTAHTATAEVNNDRLRAPLSMTDKELGGIKTVKEASQIYGALFHIHDGDTNDYPGLAFSFLPTEAGCATLVTLITNELGNEVIAAWAQTINVLPSAGQTSTGDMSSNGCEYSSPSAKLFGMTSVPSFSTDENSDRSPRITFLDLEGVTLGFFEAAEAAPKTWLLESKQGLRVELAEIKNFVDSHITESYTHPLAAGDNDVTKHLKKLLFNCRDHPDSNCPGIQVYNDLINIARTSLPDSRTGSTIGKRTRVRASFRDIKNNIYYLPLHLLRIDNDHVLADAVLN